MQANLRSQQGQVGLIILLVVVVLLTMGVSVASRSVSELKLSRQEQESTRALDYAESGIEQLLSQDFSGISTITTSNGTVPGTSQSYSGTITPQTGLNNIRIESGHTMEVRLAATAGQPQTGTLSVGWPNTSDCNIEAAVEVAIITSATEVQRYTYDRCAATRLNNFTVPSANPQTISYTGLMARIKVLYNPTELTVASTDTNFPVQSYKVKSSVTLADSTTRAVEVTKLADSLPSIFDYVLFSGDTLVKN